MATTNFGMHRYGYRSPGNRDRRAEVCEVFGERQDYDRAMHIGWCSQMYEASWQVTIRESWEHNYSDPMVVCRYIEDLVGDTIHRFHRLIDNPLRVAEMIHSLQPHFEREIHAFIERVERESIYRTADRARAEISLVTGMRPTYFGMDLAYEVENPKAKKKARELLLKNLDATQTASFKKSGDFKVTGKDGNAYTINDARSFNVVGPDGVKYCGQLVNTPIEDQMLAQKLLLEHDPDKFFKNANKSGGIAGGAFANAMRDAILTGTGYSGINWA